MESVKKEHLNKPQVVGGGGDANYHHLSLHILLSSGIYCSFKDLIGKGKKKNIWLNLKGWGVKYQLTSLVPITQLRYGLLVKDLRVSGKGEAEKPIPSLVPIFLLSSMDLLIIRT